MYRGSASPSLRLPKKVQRGLGAAGADGPIGVPWVLPANALDAWATPVGLLGKEKGDPGRRQDVVHEGKGSGGWADGDTASFLDSAMPLIRLMQITIAMPVQRRKDGAVMFKWMSPILLYSLVLFCLLSVPVYYVGRASFYRLLDKEAASFHEQIYNMTPLLLLHAHPLIPVLHWREAKSAVVYFNSWISYETGFQRVARRPLHLHMRSWVVRGTVFCLLVSMALAGTLPLYMSVSWWQSFAYFHVFLLTSTLVITWRMSASAIARAADTLRDALHGEVVRGSCSAEVLAEYRQVWLDLSELTQESGRAWTYSCGHQLLYQFLLMTVTSFGVLAGITRHSLEARTLAFGAIAVLSGFTLFAICSVAENAAEKVSQVLRDDLLTAQLRDDSQQFKNEVQMFMTALAMNPPSVNLSGYATVNRALFASLLETMVTYLVVLVQFAYSLDSPIAANGTLADLPSNVTFLEVTPTSVNPVAVTEPYT